MARRELRVDPLLVWLARARLRAVVAAARRQAPDASPVELCQRAYLALAGRPLPAADDRAGLTAAYASAQWGRPRGLRRRYRLTALGVALALAAGASALAVWLVSRGPSELGYRELAARDLLSDVFGERLPRAIAELGTLGPGDRSPEDDDRAVRQAVVRVVDAQAAELVGAEGMARLRQMLAVVRAVHERRAGAGELQAAVAALDAELVRASIPIHLDGEVLTDADGRRDPVVFVYRVEAERSWRSGERVVRAVRLRRLDHRSTRMLLMGLVRPGLPGALVLLDQAEDELMRLLLPALAPDAPLVLSARPEDDWPGRAAFERAAGARVRRELGAALGDAAPDAARAGELLGRRERIFDAIEKGLAQRGLRLTGPRRLDLADDWLDQLAGEARPEDLRSLRELAPELATPEVRRVFAAATDSFARSIEIHEVQHQLDDGAPLAMPEALQALVGPPPAGEPMSFASRARAEMSAYLAALARDQATPGVNLVLVARFVLTAGSWGAAEMPAALTILEGLRSQLQLPGGALLVDKRVQREQASELVLALLARPPDELRAAATRLWAASFGRALPPLEEGSPLVVPSPPTSRGS